MLKPRYHFCELARDEYFSLLGMAWCLVVAIVVLKIPDWSSRTRTMIVSCTDGGQKHHLEGGFLLFRSFNSSYE